MIIRRRNRGTDSRIWLAHYGLEPTIVEKAPKLRTEGYVIDFWGLGFDIADRMGLLPEIRSKGYSRHYRLSELLEPRQAEHCVKSLAVDNDRIVFL